MEYEQEMYIADQEDGIYIMDGRGNLVKMEVADDVSDD